MANARLPVLINREGGTARRAGERLTGALSEAFAPVGGADLKMLAAGEMEQAIMDAAKAGPRIVVGGGDGTIAVAAQILAGSDTELAILPLGTLNHFARDLGIPSDLANAAELAATGTPRRIDLGEVNGRYFVNNASIGLYPRMVTHRDRIRDRRGWPKWLAVVPASWAALSGLHHHRLRIDTGQGAAPILTPLLFVGNNRYSLARGELGSRDTLQDGKLSVYALSRARRLRLLGFAIRTLVGKADRDRDFETLGDVADLSVDASGRTLDIALDGEVQRMTAPLAFRIRPGALKVVA